jgi:signal transduction histidine kinase
MTEREPAAQSHLGGSVLFDAAKVSDERILDFALRSLSRASKAMGYYAVFVPQVGPNQGECVHLSHRWQSISRKIQSYVASLTTHLDLTIYEQRQIHSKRIDGLYVTSANIASSYNINIGTVVLVHPNIISHKLITTWLDTFEAIIAFRKEARALGHHRHFLGLDKRDRKSLDQEIGRIIHSAIHPHQTLIFAKTEADLFSATYMSAGDLSQSSTLGLHVRSGKNLLTQSFDQQLSFTIGNTATRDDDVLPESGFDRYAVINKLSSCIISPVSSGETSYCVIVCLFKRENAVSIVEKRAIESLAHLLSDYYRLWYRNRQVEQNHAESDEILKHVRELILIVDVLHDAAEDLVLARGQIGMLDLKTEQERQTLQSAKKILDSLITATRHLKSFYNKRESRDLAQRVSQIRTSQYAERICPSEIVSKLEVKYANELSGAKIDLRNICARDFEFFGVEHNVKRALDNAIKNSIYHLKTKTQGRREIVISAARESAEDSDSADPRYSSELIVISVIDNGPGISPDLLASVKLRYVSHRGGMGLGVPIMEAACETHGGSLDISSRWGENFKVFLRFREMTRRS